MYRCERRHESGCPQGPDSRFGGCRFKLASSSRTAHRQRRAGQVPVTADTGWLDRRHSIRGRYVQWAHGRAHPVAGDHAQARFARGARASPGRDRPPLRPSLVAARAPLGWPSRTTRLADVPVAPPVRRAFIRSAVTWNFLLGLHSEQDALRRRCRLRLWFIGSALAQG